MDMPARWLCGATAIVLSGALPVECAAMQAPLSAAYGKLPSSFESNGGQADPTVKLLCRGRGHAIFLTATEAVLSLDGPRHATAVVRMRLAGGNGNPRVAGLDPVVTKSNYLIGNDPRRWHVGIAHYARVRVESVYPGVDVVYGGNQRQLEYDFVVAPGGDPRRLRLAFSGVDAITIGAHGELILRTGSGDLVQPAPTVYQEAGARRRRIEARYVLFAPRAAKSGRADERRQVGFAIGRYDRKRPLVIDPILVYSTFLGGSGDDSAIGIAVDGSGNAYVTGITTSATFPGAGGSPIQPANAGGAEDSFVTKINAAGTAIVYSTFLGGNGDDEAIGIAVDGAGNAYVTGFTTSTTFPGVNGSSIQPTNHGGDDVFVTKLNAAGNAIVYSTFLGGLGDDDGVAIAVDGAGNAYVTGQTLSSAFPGVGAGSLQPTNGGLNAFLTKINPQGTAIVYSTFLGGPGDALGFGIAVDGAGNAYVAGQTFGATFPGVDGRSIQPANGGSSDAFVAKINAAGTAIVYATFLGGSGFDIATGLAVDDEGNALVTGTTNSPTFPGVGGGSIQPTPGGNNDVFVTKINAAGTAIVYSTFLGGSGFEDGGGIAVDHSGNAYVTGSTSSAAFPGVDGSSIQPANGGGNEDAFVTKINAAGTAIVYSTFLGAGGDDAGTSIAVDHAGNAYVAGLSTSIAFPGVSASSLQPANGGGFDAFVAKIGATGTPCGADPATSLCLNGSRFQVTATFDSGGGNAGAAHAVQLTSDTGYLWFFSSANVELVVKVLNGCSLDGHYWVFAGGLTDVNVVLSVVDSQNGTLRTYVNPPHTPFQPIQDTGAFACP